MAVPLSVGLLDPRAGVVAFDRAEPLVADSRPSRVALAGAELEIDPEVGLPVLDSLRVNRQILERLRLSDLHAHGDDDGVEEHGAPVAKEVAQITPHSTLPSRVSVLTAELSIVDPAGVGLAVWDRAHIVQTVAYHSTRIGRRHDLRLLLSLHQRITVVIRGTVHIFLLGNFLRVHASSNELIIFLQKNLNYNQLSITSTNELF